MTPKNWGIEPHTLTNRPFTHTFSRVLGVSLVRDVGGSQGSYADLGWFLICNKDRHACKHKRRRNKKKQKKTGTQAQAHTKDRSFWKAAVMSTVPCVPCSTAFTRAPLAICMYTCAIRTGCATNNVPVVFLRACLSYQLTLLRATDGRNCASNTRACVQCMKNNGAGSMSW